MSNSMRVMAIVAADACTSIVTAAPTMMKSSMVKMLSLAMCESMFATNVPMSSASADDCRKLSPMKRNANPKMNSPMLFLLFLSLKISGMPTARRGIARAAMFTLKPIAEMIQAVTVVPTLAPMITPMACDRFISPASTKLTTMTVVAELDWIMAVTRIPVSTPITRLRVIMARILRRRSPANFSSPSLIIFIP